MYRRLYRQHWVSFHLRSAKQHNKWKSYVMLVPDPFLEPCIRLLHLRREPCLKRSYSFFSLISLCFFVVRTVSEEPKLLSMAQTPLHSRYFRCLSLSLLTLLSTSPSSTALVIRVYSRPIYINTDRNTKKIRLDLVDTHNHSKVARSW